MKELESYYSWNFATLEMIRSLKGCLQSPVHHAEGDVYLHTQMVCEELKKLGYGSKDIMMLAGVLHDIAKPSTTKIEEGEIVSPGHAKLGEKYVNILLDDESFFIRSQLMAYVRLHGLPVWFNEKQNPEKAVIAASLRQIPLYDLSNLAEADFRGRICNDLDEMLFRIELFREAMINLNCSHEAYQFPSDWTRMNYFYKESQYRDADIFEPKGSWVTITVGLPGSGKNTWLKNNYEGNVVELDAIRKELKIPHSDKNGQGTVIQHAKEKLKESLRKKEDVCWNATSLTKMHRSPIIDLAMAYDAKVRIVYFDTPLNQISVRNNSRPEDEKLPNKVLPELMTKMEVPDLTECHKLEIKNNSVINLIV